MTSNECNLLFSCAATFQLFHYCSQRLVSLCQLLGLLTPLRQLFSPLSNITLQGEQPK